MLYIIRLPLPELWPKITNRKYNEQILTTSISTPTGKLHWNDAASRSSKKNMVQIIQLFKAKIHIKIVWHCSIQASVYHDCLVSYNQMNTLLNHICRTGFKSSTRKTSWWFNTVSRLHACAHLHTRELQSGLTTSQVWKPLYKRKLVKGKHSWTLQKRNQRKRTEIQT